jgi:hypothetical protein
MFGWMKLPYAWAWINGLTNRLTVGGGRSSYQKLYDGYLKYSCYGNQKVKKIYLYLSPCWPLLHLRTDTQL